MYSESFSIKKAPLKNSSLDAINGLNLSPVLESNLLFVSLSYINFAFLSKAPSISEYAFKSAILRSFLIFFFMPAS